MLFLKPWLVSHSDVTYWKLAGGVHLGNRFLSCHAWVHSFVRAFARLVVFQAMRIVATYSFPFFFRWSFLFSLCIMTLRAYL